MSLKNDSEQLNVAIFKSSFISPLRTIYPDELAYYPTGIRFIGGIYDNLNKAHEDSLLKTSTRLKQIHAIDYTIERDNAKKIHNKAIYGGIISSHYGHFLLESLARAWYIYHSSEDVYFYYPEKNNITDISYKHLLPWQQTILAHLVLDIGRIKIITTPLVFDELIVPDAGFIIGLLCANKQAQTLSLLGARITANYKADIIADKVWLSRSLLKKARIAGEHKFEQALIKEGFVIVYPEILALAEQIKLFEHATVLAGFTGSAFHTLLLAKNKGAKILHFYRYIHPNDNYKLCIEATQFNAEFYNFFLQRGRIIKPVRANVLQDLTAVWQVLFEQGLVKTKTYHDSLMIEELERLDKELDTSF